MIRITIELVPYGYEEGKKEIGKGYIVNDGTGSVEDGNYYAYFNYEGYSTYVSRVEKFPRTEKNVWELLQKALVKKKKDKGK